MPRLQEAEGIHRFFYGDKECYERYRKGRVSIEEFDISVSKLIVMSVENVCHIGKQTDCHVVSLSVENSLTYQ